MQTGRSTMGYSMAEAGCSVGPMFFTIAMEELRHAMPNEWRGALGLAGNGTGF